MSYPCRMTDPFLPIYDFAALEAEPDPIPVAPINLYDFFDQKMEEAMYKTLLDVPPATPKPAVVELLRRAGRITFDPAKYGVVVVSTPVIPWSAK